MTESNASLSIPEPEALPLPQNAETADPVVDSADTSKSNNPGVKATDRPTTPEDATSDMKMSTAAKEPKTPKTPRSKRTTPAKRATEDEENSVKSAKKAKGSPANARQWIPQSVDEMKPEDKMLVKFKEEGKPWSVINAEWEKMTGVKPGGSTLPNRYNRIKAAIACVAEADMEQLKASAAAIDDAIDAEHKDALCKKWARVAKHMKEHGVGTDYQPSTLEKQFKKLQAAESTLPTSAAAAAENGEQDYADEEPESVSSDAAP
ncbi:uncharacterized protein PV09_07909 [Verruconis gallopava]|uniref:Myb-like domain-containing protein n=1 Tax=Verruconis gallopava TaxID=253628 RepID=A0A0D2AN66_9PEZI|nr:uncharacterized protein PV09_07909 [Verruconis gallopava]KIW00554.1 hypothetical protein PV09_07909 [Verruconis gallopava]